MLIFLITLFTLSSQAFTIKSNNEQRGLEILMNGVGQARLGSYGSLAGNSSLLAWAEVEQKFISTSYLMLADSKETSAKISPTFIPTLAASVEKWGDLAVSYGLIGETYNLQGHTMDDFIADYKSTSTNYSGVLALAKKMNSHFALGMNLSLDYYTSEVTGSSHSANELFTYSNSDSAITSSLGLNASWKKEQWGFGFSMKSPFAKLYSSGHQEHKVSSQSYPDIIIQKDEKKPHVIFEREYRVGASYYLGDHHFYSDFSYVPQYRDEETEETTAEQWEIDWGHEYLVNNKYTAFYGLSYSEESYQGSMGFSKKNNHSISFYGVGVNQARNNDFTTYLLSLGTYFDY